MSTNFHWSISRLLLDC